MAKSRLTVEQMLTFRKRGFSYKKIGRIAGISRACAWNRCNQEAVKTRLKNLTEGQKECLVLADKKKKASYQKVTLLSAKKHFQDWTDQEKIDLESMAKTHTIARAARALGRSYFATNVMIHRLGISFKKESLQLV